MTYLRNTRSERSQLGDNLVILVCVNPSHGRVFGEFVGPIDIQLLFQKATLDAIGFIVLDKVWYIGLMPNQNSSSVARITVSF
jgi:hypothetical protein